jgi:RNA 2',3'-cyclic 3'-phosphodiesterase
MRVFVALDLEEEIRIRIQRFIEETRGLAPDARWANPESSHVTLKFIGEKPEPAVKDIEAALGGIKDEPVQLSFRGCGFFPNPKAARVFWVGIKSQELPGLAENVDRALAEIGIPPEERAYTPHLTLARGGGGSGAPHRQRGDKANQRFARLQEKLANLPEPDFGTMTAREFFLYRSELGRGGSRYTKIARFSLQSSGQ